MSTNQQLLVAVPLGVTPPPGQQLIESSGTWVCPAGVTSISVVCVGVGANGYGSLAATGGGALSYVNNITVIPGNSYTCIVEQPVWYISQAADVNFANLVIAGSGKVNGTGGAVIIGTGGAGGNAGPSGYTAVGGGGAGGYAGPGGNGGAASYPAPFISPGNGSGGSAAGGHATAWDVGAFSAPGGGVGVMGQGTSGVASQGTGGQGSTGGSAGGNGTYSYPALGGNYGGGGGNSSTQMYTGGAGAIRIIWPGNLRQFPSTRTADE